MTISADDIAKAKRDLVKTLKSVAGVDDVQFLAKPADIVAAAVVREHSIQLSDLVHSAEDEWRDRWPNVRLDLHVMAHQGKP